MIAAAAERALSTAEAEAAFSILFEGQATPSQIGGFLIRRHRNDRREDCPLHRKEPSDDESHDAGTLHDKEIQGQRAPDGVPVPVLRESEESDQRPADAEDGDRAKQLEMASRQRPRGGRCRDRDRAQKQRAARPGAIEKGATRNRGGGGACSPADIFEDIRRDRRGRDRRRYRLEAGRSKARMRRRVVQVLMGIATSVAGAAIWHFLL